MTKQKSSKPTNPDPIHQVSQNAFIREFSEFINRGNVIDLAIGVAVGGAFTAIVTSLVNDIIMPITSLLAGGLDFTNLAIDIPNIFGAESTAHIAYGNFLQNVVNFLLVAFTIFIVVRTLNRINRRNDAAQAAAQAAQDAKTAKAAKKAQDDKDAAAKKADDARTAQIAQITKILKSNPPKFGK